MKAPYGNMSAYLNKEIHLTKTGRIGKLIHFSEVYNTISGWGDSREYHLTMLVNGVEFNTRCTPSDIEFADPNEPKGYGYRD